MKTLMFKSEYAKMFHSEEVLWWYQGLRDLIAHYIKEYSIADAAILDVGCGTGKNIEFLKSLGYEKIEGIDYSPDAIEFCARRGVSQVKVGSITSIEHPNNSFDVVLCMDVLGCLEEDDRLKAVSELFRVLKPGGLLLANSASLEVFRSQHDNVGNIKIRFTKDQLTELFSKYNFQILKVSYRVFLLSPLVGLFKFSKKLIQRLRPNQTPQSDQVVFPYGINWMLLHLQLLDNKLFRVSNLPFGSSLFVAARKGKT